MSRRTAPDFHANARAGWGATPPDWIMAVADECAATNQTAAGRRLGVSGSQVCQVLANKYPSPLDSLEAMVRGVLMGACLACPVLGEIGSDRCLTEQKRPFSASSSVRVRLYRACRAGCPHSRIKE